MALVAGEDAAPRKSPSMVLTVMAIIGLSVVAVGGGWYLGGILGPKKAEAEKAAEIHIEHGKHKQVDVARQGQAAIEGDNVVLLQPLTTNLAYPSDTWVRLEVVLQFRDKPELAMTEAIHQDLMAYMRTVSLQQIQGARGFEHLRDDLQRRAVLRSHGAVVRLLLRTFVVQ